MADGGMDLSAVIEKLMANSDTAEMIEKLKASVENIPDQSEKSEMKVTEEGKTDFSDLSEKLPKVMAALGPLIESGTLGKGHLDNSSEKRNNLLAALRPYLNEGRKGMIDSIMTLSKFTRLIDLIPRDK